MIVKGQLMYIGATFDAENLDVAVNVLTPSGWTGWMAAANYDGNTYRVAYTPTVAGAYSAKTVVFLDPGFTMRDELHPEADVNFQVVDLSQFFASPANIVGVVEPVQSIGGVVNLEQEIAGAVEG